MEGEGWGGEGDFLKDDGQRGGVCVIVAWIRCDEDFRPFSCLAHGTFKYYITSQIEAVDFVRKSVIEACDYTVASA